MAGLSWTRPGASVRGGQPGVHSGVCPGIMVLLASCPPACGPCCEYGGEVYRFLLDETFTPDDNIRLLEPLRPAIRHLPDTIRPTADNDGDFFKVPEAGQSQPSITIDIDHPGYPNR